MKGNCDRAQGHSQAPARGALGRTGAGPEGTGALGKASRGEAPGRTGADPAGTGALGRASRGEALGSTGANPQAQGPGNPH